MTKYKVFYYVKEGAIKSYELNAATWEIEHGRLLVFYDKDMEFIEAFVLDNIVNFEKVL